MGNVAAALAVGPPRRKGKPFQRSFQRCPRCHSPTRPTLALNGQPSQFWLECVKCNTYINTYIPQSHQEAVHKDPHRIIGNFGAYGTGKTTTTREEIYKHVLITPNANVMVGANIQPQYEQTIKRELEADLPAAFVKDVSVQQRYLDLLNGARIMFRPYDDADKLRSYNLTMAVGVEASEYKSEVFHQHKTRLRNTAACTFKMENGSPVLEFDDRGVGVPVIEADWRKILVESNPDSGWIRTDVLAVADEIHQYGTATEQYVVPEDIRDTNIAVHIASTDVNRFLPPNYISEICKNKPKWWVARYVFGSFSYSEGLVYPTALTHFVPEFEIPRHWRRIIAFDYGLSDDAVYLFGAIDQIAGILYIYKEIRVNNRNVDELSQLYFDNITDIPSGGLVCQPIADPKSIAKRDYNKDSLGDLFLQKGIYFKPGFVSIDARVMRLNTYLESGKLKIFDTCTGLRTELADYKFPAQSLDRTRVSDKPIDKRNHGINALEWIVMELPDSPGQLVLGTYNRLGLDPMIDNRPKMRPWQLSDPGNNPFADPDNAFGMAPIYTQF